MKLEDQIPNDDLLPELRRDIREQVDSLLEKLDVTGLEVRIGSLERALARVEGERDQQLRRVAELERDRDRARNLVQTWQELAADVESERDRAKARIAELERERDEARERAICAASSEARRIDERDIAYAALTSAAKALAANDFDLAREVLCRSSARDKAAELRRADMKHTLAAAARAEKAEARVAELEAQKNGAYSERNKLVAALSKVFPAALSRHPDEDTTWDNDWRWIVFVDLPTGQASWHIHDSEKPLFDHLRHEQRVWDGHTTDQKYARLAALGKEDDRG